MPQIEPNRLFSLASVEAVASALAVQYRELLLERERTESAEIDARTSCDDADREAISSWHEEAQSRELEEAVELGREENLPATRCFSRFDRLEPEAAYRVLDRLESIFEYGPTLFTSRAGLPGFFSHVLRPEILDLVVGVLPVSEGGRILDVSPGLGFLTERLLSGSAGTRAHIYPVGEPTDESTCTSRDSVRTNAGFDVADLQGRMLPLDRVTRLSGRSAELLGQLDATYDCVLCVPPNWAEICSDPLASRSWSNLVFDMLERVAGGGSFAAVVAPEVVFNPRFRQFLSSGRCSLRAAVAMDLTLAYATASLRGVYPEWQLQEARESEADLRDRMRRSPLFLFGWGVPTETMWAASVRRRSDISLVVSFLRGQGGERLIDAGEKMLTVSRARFFGLVDAILHRQCADARSWRTVPKGPLSSCAKSVGRCTGVRETHLIQESTNVFEESVLFLNQRDFSPERLYFGDGLVRPRVADRLLQGSEVVVAFIDVDVKVASRDYLETIMASDLAGPVADLVSGRLSGLVEAGNDDAALADALVDVPFPLPEMRDQMRIVDAQRMAQDLAEDPVQILENPETVAKIIAQILERPLNGFEVSVYEGYPFLIAYPYHLLRSVIDIPSLQREQLRVAENLLAYLASLALCVVPEASRSELGADLKSSFEGGVSPGDWQQIAQKSIRLAALRSDSDLALELDRLRVGSSKSGMGKSVQILVKAKNDFKHDRAPTSGPAQTKSCDEVEIALRTCYEQLSFLTRFRHSLIVDVDAVRGNRTRLRLTGLSLVGSHPGHPRVDFESDVHVPKNDVCVHMTNGQVMSLYPFITSRTCPTCAMRENYFIDRWDYQRGIVTLKSFERGHTVVDDGWGEELRRWSGD